MSSRAMASQKNKRTMGPQFNSTPQPLPQTLSSSQRLAALQQSSVPTPQNFGNSNFGSRGSEFRQSSNGKVELSIPEAFAMLNKKIASLEEILNSNGVNLDEYTGLASLDAKVNNLESKMKLIDEKFTTDEEEVSSLKNQMVTSDKFESACSEILRLHDEVSILKELNEKLQIELGEIKSKQPEVVDLTGEVEDVVVDAEEEPVSVNEELMPVEDVVVKTEEEPVPVSEEENIEMEISENN